MPFPPGYIDIQEAIESRRGPPFVKAGEDREYTLVFRIVISDRSFGPNEVCQCPGLPSPYQMYITPDGGEYDWSAFCIRIEPKKQVPDDWQVWLVECTYSTNLPQGGVPDVTDFGMTLPGSQNDPSQWLPVFRWDSETVTMAYPADMNGNPFLNSCGQPFTPAPVFEVARPVLIMTRNQLSLTRAQITSYAYAINSDTFLGAAPGTVRLRPIRAVQSTWGTLPYWKDVTYEFVFNRVAFPLPVNNINAALAALIGGVGFVPGLGIQPLVSGDDPLESWQPQILDAGTTHINDNDLSPGFGQPLPILRRGIPITQPVPLNGAGQEAFRVNGVVQPVYLDFTVYRALPFSPLLQGYNTGFIN